MSSISKSQRAVNGRQMRERKVVNALQVLQDSEAKVQALLDEVHAQEEAIMDECLEKANKSILMGRNKKPKKERRKRKKHTKLKRAVHATMAALEITENHEAVKRTVKHQFHIDDQVFFPKLERPVPTKEEQERYIHTRLKPASWGLGRSNSTPGPGEYTLPDGMSAFGMAGHGLMHLPEVESRMSRLASQTPGPGHYDVSKGIETNKIGGGHIAMSRVKSDVDWQIHYKAGCPGPGHYGRPALMQKAPSVVMAARMSEVSPLRRPRDDDPGPGPGQYQYRICEWNKGIKFAGPFKDPETEEDDAKSEEDTPEQVDFSFSSSAVISSIQGDEPHPRCSSRNDDDGTEILDFDAGTGEGMQPSGTMTIRRIEADGESLEVTFSFPDGVQNARHPEPGESYTGREDKHLFSDDTEGRDVLKFSRLQFENGLLYIVKDGATMLNAGD